MSLREAETYVMEPVFVASDDDARQGVVGPAKPAWLEDLLTAVAVTLAQPCLSGFG